MVYVHHPDAWLPQSAAIQLALQKITDRLELQGPLPSDLARYFEHAGVDGIRETACDCPTSNFYTRELIHAGLLGIYEVMVNGISVYVQLRDADSRPIDEGGMAVAAVELSFLMRTFIRNFDNGMYQYLDREWPEELADRLDEEREDAQ
jgi:hypothetical protein